MLNNPYTHIDSATARYCRIVRWSLPQSTVRSPGKYDMGEDEYEVQTTNLDLIEARPISTEDINEAFEAVYKGHQYGEDERENALWWFKQGYISGSDTR